MIKILYIEDEPFLGKIVKESLESRGFEILMLEHGLELMTHYQEFNPNICVLDVMLPHKDGFALAKEIRAVNKQIPILFLTAKVQTEDVINGFGAGGNDYIRKPFSMEELIVRINNLLKTKVIISTNGNEITIGKFIFSPSRFEISLESRVTKLSQKEANLVALFAQNQNEILERKDILLKLWNDDSFFNSRNLDVYINKIRKILISDPNLEIITLKGVGYVLKVN